MSEAYPSEGFGGAIRSEIGDAAVRPTDWLCLEAAPAFASMAFLTGVLGGGEPEIPCSARENTSPLSGMVLMLADEHFSFSAVVPADLQATKR
jgi:hypothetical protein